MSWRTLAFLVVVVAGLAWYALRTADHEQQALAERDVALFPALDENQVVAIRIENVTRDLHMRFERDGKGGWRMTDPLEARGETAPLDLIVQAAVRARGAPVSPDETADLAKLGLDPPRFVLDVESSVVGSAGATVRQRAEIGAVELDGLRIFANANGRVLRVVRELEPLLDMPMHELRASSVSGIDPRTVVEVRRTGSIGARTAGPSLDAGFEAVRANGEWTATSPVVGRLDPAAIGLFVQSATTYRYEKIVDEGARTLASLGLDPPELSVRFGTIGTDVVEIALGRTGVQREGGWLGTAVGSSVVWAIPANDVEFFGLPLEDLLDHKLVRARRGAIERLEIGSSAGEVRLLRGPKFWSCEIARAGSSVFGTPERAETRVVEDVLGELERYELAAFVRGATFDPSPSPVRWKIAGEGAETGGTFGAAYVDATGASDVLFQRLGETAVSHGGAQVAERLARDPVGFLTLELLATAEVDLAGLVIHDAASELHYERNAKGIWVRKGGEVEARELRDVIESLLFVRASERIPESSQKPLADAIEIELAAASGRRHIVVGRTGEGAARRVEADVDGRRGVLLDARLHEKLAALLAAK